MCKSTTSTIQILHSACRCQYETVSWATCGFVAEADSVRSGNLMTLNVKVLAVRSRYKLPPLRGTQASEITLQHSPNTEWEQ
jgi:hypothetical protein